MCTPVQRLCVSLLILVCVVASCTPYQVRTLDRPHVPVQKTYHHSQDGKLVGTRVIGEWWTEFNDPALNAVIQVALAESLDLRQLWSRLTQAHAQAQIEGAQLSPQVDLRGGGARTHQKDREAIDSQGGHTSRISNTDRYFVSYGLSYEIDLWKRISSQRQAAGLEYEASRQDVEASALFLTGSIVDVWYIL